MSDTDLSSGWNDQEPSQTTGTAVSGAAIRDSGVGVPKTTNNGPFLGQTLASTNGGGAAATAAGGYQSSFGEHASTGEDT